MYKTAQEAPADDMGPQGIDLISFTGAFPPQVVHGWAEQNVAPLVTGAPEVETCKTLE